MIKNSTYVFDKNEKEIWKVIKKFSNTDYSKLQKVYPKRIDNIYKLDSWIERLLKCDACSEPLEINLDSERDINEIIREFADKFPEGFI